MIQPIHVPSGFIQVPVPGTSTGSRGKTKSSRNAPRQNVANAIANAASQLAAPAPAMMDPMMMVIVINFMLLKLLYLQLSECFLILK